jgi:hypothetical protein
MCSGVVKKTSLHRSAIGSSKRRFPSSSEAVKLESEEANEDDEEVDICSVFSCGSEGVEWWVEKKSKVFVQFKNQSYII